MDGVVSNKIRTADCSLVQIVSSLKRAQTYPGRRKSRSQTVTTFGKYSADVAMRGVGAGCPIASYFHDTITDKAHIALRDSSKVYKFKEKPVPKCHRRVSLFKRSTSMLC